MAVHPDLIELVRCPRCRGQLALQPAGDAFACSACRVFYPVIDDIPQLLIEEAQPLEVR